MQNKETEKKNKPLSRLAVVKDNSLAKKLSGTEKPGTGLFDKTDVVRFLVAMLVVFALTLLISPHTRVPDQSLKKGDIAAENIKSPADILVEDKLSTEESKKRTAEEYLDIYDFDDKIAGEIAVKISSAFKMMHTAYTINIPGFTFEKAKEEIDPETDDAQNNEQLLADKEELKRKTVEFKKSDLFIEKQKEFVELLGVELKDKALKTLAWHNFKPEIKEIFTKYVSKSMRNGIVSDKKLINQIRKKNIVTRKLETDIEKVVPIESILDIEASTILLNSIADDYIDKKRHPALWKVVISIGAALIKPNLTFNKKETEEGKKAAVEAVKPVLFQMKKGEMILRVGERVTEKHLMKLKAMRPEKVGERIPFVSVGIAIFILLVFYLVWLYMHKFKVHLIKDNRSLALLSAILVVNFTVVRVLIVLSHAISEYMSVDVNSFYYAMPYAAGTMLVSILFDIDITIMFSLLTFSLAGLLVEGGFAQALVALTGGLAATFRSNQYRHRSAILKTGLIIGVINMLTVFPIDIINNTIFSMTAAYDMAMGLVGGLVIVVVVSVILPILESLFEVTSDIRLLELADPNHPLLAQMVIHAPGTYQHSHLVANLSEEAAEAVGANPLLVRVGSYFHDIGKMKKADYFIENQQMAANSRHDNLTPSMSSLVLISHVKDGIELAKEYKVVPKIIDFIREHHGNGLIAYFYNKAKIQEDPNSTEIKEQDFRYPGPRPRSKETAIVMLADSVEAASRTLDEPTHSRLKGLVHKIINSKFIDGQLDDCDLSLKDLSKISDSFIRILTGIFHFRVDYAAQEEAGKSSMHMIVNGKQHSNVEKKKSVK